MSLTEFGHHLHNLLSCSRVQIASGFICQYKTWTIDQSPGYGNSLHLPAGNFVRIVITPLPEFHVT